ncbi:Acyl-coenzyme A thioesterase 9, mitochondrial [Willisornis vidua]|uniref:Acyl-coenzyme A thioesterase 9, mitochondrial n=1 Tax=Willisornis vidua TaxID=1566151 RepID=A0ABQ9DMR5_9PASS|nr:Acyl-coenzyme A thioesterase 9, mitochondrial [Willisornis vidua]
MLPSRLCTMRKLPSVLARTFTPGTAGSPGLPDMSEAKSGRSSVPKLGVKYIAVVYLKVDAAWEGTRTKDTDLTGKDECSDLVQVPLDHVQAMQERKALHTLLAKRQEDLPPRRMKDSYLEVILPLGSQPEIREKYLNVHNSVRFGRILEDLDSLGVLICYTHTKQETQPKSPLSIVTALVDKINLCKKIIYPDCDIKFTGNVSWVGKTSMEVTMHMLQLHDGEYSPVLDATFVMVARDPENKWTVSFRSRKLPPNSVWMEDAKLKGLQICHPEERNIFNRIFGGFLMRKAFELGWATACSYGSSRPFIVSVDDIMFQKPVEIGSLLLLSAQVCYTEKNYIQIRVHSEVYDANTREHHTTNIFHFTFISENEVPRVVPNTYGGKYAINMFSSQLC